MNLEIDVDDISTGTTGIFIAKYSYCDPLIKTKHSNEVVFFDYEDGDVFYMLSDNSKRTIDRAKVRNLPVVNDGRLDTLIVRMIVSGQGAV